VHFGEEIDDFWLNSFLKIEVGQFKISHINERLLGPLHEPVDGRVGNESGEVAAAFAETVAGGREAKAQMQVVLQFVELVVPFLGMVHCVAFHVGPQRPHQIVFVRVALQSLDHCIRDHGVYCFQELLMDNVRVVEHKHLRSYNAIFIQFFEIFEQLFFPIVSR
jgi:hypothetical protein